jgi:hypothetical protein
MVVVPLLAVGLSEQGKFRESAAGEIPFLQNTRSTHSVLQTTIVSLLRVVF